MKTIQLLAAVAVLGSQLHTNAEIPTTITYQGRVQVSGANFTGTGQFKFALVDAGSNAVTHWSNDGSSAAGSEPAAAVSLPVAQGLFTALLGDATVPNMTAIPPDVLTNLAVRLRIWFNDGANGFAALGPDQPLTSAPYALHALNARTAMTANTITGPVPAALLVGTIAPANLADGGIDASKLAADSVTSSKIADGTIQLSDLGSGVSNAFWRLGGNNGTIPGLDFLGTTDNQPLEVRVSNQAAWRVFPTTNGYPNLIGGVSNTVGTGVRGATVAGGYLHALGNNINAPTIGGGFLNSIQANAASISGGAYNTNGTGAIGSTIAGGTYHSIRGINSTISGGIANSIRPGASYSTIGGGDSNSAQTNSTYSTIGGGALNSTGVNADYATVPGGALNEAGGDFSLAAGFRAKANHQGAFVWADTQNVDFPSSTSNQFSVRASGGVRFETGGAGMAVDGQAVVAGNDAGSFTNLNASELVRGTVPDARLAAEIARTNQVWLLGGNAGLTPGAHFLGTIDNQPVELRAENTRALRIEPGADGAPNLIGGSPINAVGPGVKGATIGGGGITNFFGDRHTNRVDADFGTIGGGLGNLVQGLRAAVGSGFRNAVQSGASHAIISGGMQNVIQSNAFESAIGGGSQNTIRQGASKATVSGGRMNTVGEEADFAVIAGGGANTIQSNALWAAIGGGGANVIGGDATYATVPGGRENSAMGAYSFAAGHRAKAIHVGAFVWADSTDADISSTADNEFVVRAGGGVRFATGGTGMRLDGLPVIAGVVNSAQLADGAVIATKIADGSVGTSKLAAGSVTPAAVAPDSMGSAQLAVNAVGVSELQNNAVSSAKLQDSSVTTTKLLDGSVTTGKLADRNVMGTKIAIGGIELEHLAASIANALVPPGTIVAFAGATPPPGWLLCDGTQVSRTTYSTLFARIGGAWGQGNGSTTFHLPDLRGIFLRGVNGTRAGTFSDPDADGRILPALGGNAGNNVGSFQVSAVGLHTHTYQDSRGNPTSGVEVDTYESGTNDSLYREDIPRTTGSAGGDETRPNNAYVHYIIKS